MNPLPSSTNQVEPERPWLGLEAFSRGTKDYFFGRDHEIGNLLDRVRYKTLTVLYGPSGLGKTSLLQAGLIPRLEDDGFLPVSLRLTYPAAGETIFPTEPVRQIRGALATALRDAGHEKLADACLQHEGGLWSLFHYRASGFLERGAPRLVLLFDQFEEIFTLGESRGPDEAQAFRNELASLLGNRPPAAASRRMELEAEFAERFDFSEAPVKAVLVLREDYLSRLERWRGVLPSLMDNRMELRLLNGPQALQAVIQPGLLRQRERPEAVPLVSGEVGVQIVRAIAGAEPDAPLESIDAVPPYLSLLCEQLNERRFVADPPLEEITCQLLAKGYGEILGTYYKECFRDLDPGVRLFVEDKLLSPAPDNHREAVSWETAVAAMREAKVSDPTKALESLRGRRLLTVDDRDGSPRIELTHDILADEAAKSRDQRTAREDRRRLNRARLVTGLVAVLAVGAIGAAWWAVDTKRTAVTEARRAIAAERKSHELLQEASRASVGAARDRRDQGSYGVALGHLAVALGYFPSNQIALSEVSSLLARSSHRMARMPRGELLRHEDVVGSATFSPDGRWVVTASEDKTARVWEAATGKAVGEPLRHGGLVSSAMFSPDGRWVATASEDTTAQVWEAATGKAVGEPLRHGRQVSSVTFSPDARWVVTASNDTTARVWEAATGEAVGEPLRHDDQVRKATFSPDGRWVVTASSDATARVWEAATGKAVGAPLRHGGQVSCAMFSPDGRWVVTTSGHTAQVWEATTGKAVGEPLRHGGRVYSATFGPDGRWVVTASNDATARVWEAATGKAVGEPLRHDSAVYSATFGPDGRWVVTASYDTTARVWEAATGTAAGEPLRHDGALSSVVFSPEGRLVVTTSGHTARVWEAATGKAVGEPLRHDGWVIRAMFSPDGRWVVTASYDTTARVWEAATGKAVGEPLRHDALVSSATFSPDGRLVVTVSADNTARVWEAATGKAVGEPLRRGGLVSSATFSPDGRWVVTVSADNTARVWEAATGKVVGEPLRHGGRVSSATFSPDGRWVVTASADNTARVWEAATGRAVGELLRHGGQVYSATFSPDGRWVVTASVDNTARVWEAATGKAVGEPLRHDGAVSSAKFSPDGRWVVTASDDTTARVWEAATDSLEGLAFSAELQLTLVAIGGTEILEGAQRALSIEDRLARLSSSRAFSGGDHGQTSAGLVNWKRLLDWCLETPRLRTISPSSHITVPEHIDREIAWVAAHPSAENNTQILVDAYELDPGHPLIHLALALVEEDPARAEFLRDFGLRRILPLASVDQHPGLLRRAAGLLEHQPAQEGRAAECRRRADELDQGRP